MIILTIWWNQNTKLLLKLGKSTITDSIVISIQIILIQAKLRTVKSQKHYVRKSHRAILSL